MNEILPGNYIAGFVDGEGCFALKFRRDVRHERKNKPEYFYWDIEFAICLRGDDREILEKIQKTIDCGRISSDRRGMIRYSVSNINDLYEKVVPFFDAHSLRAKKRFDFFLWKEAVIIFYRNQRKGLNMKKGQQGFSKTEWITEDLQRLQDIHEEMKIYKSKRSEEWKWLKNQTLV